MNVVHASRGHIAQAVARTLTMPVSSGAGAEFHPQGVECAPCSALHMYIEISHPSLSRGRRSPNPGLWRSSPACKLLHRVHLQCNHFKLSNILHCADRQRLARTRGQTSAVKRLAPSLRRVRELSMFASDILRRHVLRHHVQTIACRASPWSLCMPATAC